MEARFVVMDVDTVVDILPAPESWTHAGPLDDIPALSLKYSSLAAGGPLAATLVDQGYDLALQVNGRGGDWLEPPGARFVVTDDGSDPSNEAGMIEITGLGVVEYDFGGILGQNLSSVASFDVESGRWVFTAATAGKILRGYMDTNADYHSITPTFTATHDSNGQPWLNQFSRLELEPTKSLLQILQAMADQDFLDWSSQGNTLNAYNPETALKRNRTNVELMFGRECTDGPQRRSRRDFASDVVAMGDGGRIYTRANPTPIVGRRGRRAVGASGSVSSEADAIVASDAIFSTSGQLVREQLTRALDFSQAAYLPYLDYRAGDTVMAPGKGNMPEALRIRQITLQGKGAEVIGGSIVLNDRFLEASVRAARRLARLEGGAGKGMGGSTPTTPEAGKRKPALPSGGTIEQTGYFNEDGYREVVATISWAPVTTDVDGIPIGIQRYEVRARRVINL